MRKITVALLSAAYLCLALTAVVLLWRSGGGWGAGLSGLLGALGLAFALHGMISRSLDRAQLSSEIAAVRDANLILVRQLEHMQGAIGKLGYNVNEDAARRSEELTSEVRMLEALVQRMSESLDERLANASPYAVASPQAAPRRDQRQTAVLLQEVREALAENRVDLYLQPVVSLPQRRTVFYESYTRLRDESGRVMMPAEYLPCAEPEGLVSAIDNLLLFRCVQIVRRLAKQDRRIGIFCNISMSSLGDDQFFPQFIELLAANRDLSNALIFEVGQAAFDARGPVEARNMGRLADLGFRFSIDKITNLDFDLQDFARADVSFVKVGAQMLLEQLVELDGRLVLRAMPDLAAEDFAALTRRYGMQLIAEKVENERQVVDILELNIPLGQGNLFGEPRAIRDSVLAETGSPSGPTLGRAAPLRRMGGRY
jgi:cyclic-di-GMP phosphodiesterase TipF (flagellum assembly factor)